MTTIRKGSLIEVPSGERLFVKYVYKNFGTTGCCTCPPSMFNQKWYAAGPGIFPEQDVILIK